MTFDGGDHSHAGIVRGGQVTETLGDGINHRPVGISASAAKYVDVYRFTKNGDRLGGRPYPVPPLPAAIQVFEAAKNVYAYDEILLLALPHSSAFWNLELSWSGDDRTEFPGLRNGAAG